MNVLELGFFASLVLPATLQKNLGAESLQWEMIEIENVQIALANSHLTLLRRQRAQAIELRTIFWGFFSSGSLLIAPTPPSSAPLVPGLGSLVDEMLGRCWVGEPGCRYVWCCSGEKASA
jgi:hypothetical protein